MHEFPAMTNIISCGNLEMRFPNMKSGVWGLKNFPYLILESDTPYSKRKSKFTRRWTAYWVRMLVVCCTGWHSTLNIEKNMTIWWSRYYSIVANDTFGTVLGIRKAIQVNFWRDFCRLYTRLMSRKYFLLAGIVHLGRPSHIFWKPWNGGSNYVT